MWQKITSVGQLRDLCMVSEPLEVVVMLQFGLRSTKLVSYHDGLWYIDNLIDDSSEDELKTENMLRCTTLGIALTEGTLWYNTDDTVSPNN